MKISVKKHYKVFRRGTAYNLSDFTVLTGKNGSGKTNFLFLLFNKDSSVEIDGIDKSDLNIQFYSHDHFTTNPSRTRQSIGGYDDTSINRSWKAYQKYMTDEVRNEALVSQFDRILTLSGKEIEDLTEEDFKKFPLSRSNENLRIFTYQFFEDTSIYLSHLNRNKYNHFLNVEYGENNLYFNEDEFIELYGTPPWESLNEIFVSVGFKYRFIQPINLDGRGSIEFKMFDTVHEVEISIKDLSNGERTILKTICSIYDLRIANEVPDILLFDEIDALLHPTYSKFIVSILHDYIVKRMNKKVVLVTHSPSTVAISPPESIYLCNRKDFSIEKVSKDYAIADLTENLNSLSILHENRRQVFTEDREDAYFYEFIYNKLKPRLYQEISLNFIPISDARNEESGGSSKVVSIVKTLSRHGNKYVFGIIDRDLDNITNNHVFVTGERYSIENYIFDPVFLVAYFLREKLIDGKQLGLETNFKYFNLTELKNAQLQEAINKFIKIIDLEITSDEFVSIKYINGKTIRVSKDFFRTRGHSLEKELLGKYQTLKGRVNLHGSFKRSVIKEVIEDLTGFISIEFLNLFKKIQKK